MAETPPSGTSNDGPRPRVIPPNLLMAFILVTSLFALWGFANDITNPMVAAFKNILLLSYTESARVQFAFSPTFDMNS